MEHRLLLRAGLALLASAVSVPPLVGWSAKGHRIVALAAQEQLSENSKRRIGYLLGKDVGLVDVAAWANDIVVDRPETEAWHSITLPADAQHVDLQRDCPLGDCVTAKLRECIGIVRLAIRPKSEIVESFKMLVNLAADMHQPMLNGYPPAQGKEESVVVLDNDDMPLFDAWESALLQRMGPEEEIAARVRQRIAQSDTETWKLGTYRDWTWETHRLAVDRVYPMIREPGGKTVLEGTVLSEASELLLDQLAKSAVRLAHVLDITWP